MTTVTKILITALVSLFFASCHWDINLGEGKKGNGNVTSEKRNVTEDFHTVKATEGLDVYVEQGDDMAIEVEADENIIEYIRTDINNGVLKIHTEERIGRAKSKKVHVRLPEVRALHSSSGADLYGKGIITADNLVLDASSGSDLKVEVAASEVNCDSSSGADIKVSGTANVLIADASSGSDINARELTVKKCIAEASSGADITVNATEELSASASSGADINYSGNPEIVKKNKSSSGSVSKQ